MPEEYHKKIIFIINKGWREFLLTQTDGQTNLMIEITQIFTGKTLANFYEDTFSYNLEEYIFFHIGT